MQIAIREIAMLAAAVLRNKILSSANIFFEQ
jgi:hypothetical protein